MLEKLLFDTRIGDLILSLFERLTGLCVEYDDADGWALCCLDNLPG